MSSAADSHETISDQIINKTLNAQAKEILQFLNEKAGRAFHPDEVNMKLIIAQLKTGATVVDCKQIIAKKVREWKGIAEMAIYLRPATLFNATKFSQYRGELVIPAGGAPDELIMLDSK